MRQLSHLDEHGRARMVDVSGKPPTRRRSLVEGVISLSPAAYELLTQNRLEKGDALLVAKIAGIQAAKRTAELIPLCHPLPLDHVDIRFEPDGQARAIRVIGETVTRARTGVEMEAFTAVAVALLTLYDMVKSADPAAVIGPIRLLEKTGGKQNFRKEDACAPRW